MSTNPETLRVLPARDLRGLVQSLRRQNTSSRLVGGSLIMLVGSTLVAVLNFGYNMVAARMLGKSAFAEAAAAVTLQLIVSAMTLSFQLVCAKFVARNEGDAQKSYVYHALLRRSWKFGAGVGLVLALLSVPGAAWLQMASPAPMFVLAAGLAFYVPLGVKRGGLQGTCRFRYLSANFVLETVVKMAAAVILLKAGFGVFGAVAAISLSVVAAYFISPVPPELRKQPEPGLPASFAEGMQASVFFVGQVIINNIDILLVNHFFRPEIAGLYAAIALVGRVLYIASWQVVSAMFPIAAGGSPSEKRWSVIALPVAFVTLLALAFLGLVGFFPDQVLHVLFGSGFRIEHSGASNLLVLRTLASGIYALSVVVMTYEMSRRIANTGWFQLAVAGCVVLGITLFHRTLSDVILVQQVLMLILFSAVAVLFVRKRRVHAEEAA